MLVSDNDPRPPLERLGRWLAAAAIGALAAAAVGVILSRKENPEHPRSGRGSQLAEHAEKEAQASIDEAPAEVEVGRALSVADFEFYGLSHAGNSRTTNQDTFRVVALPELGPDYALAVVCDGMGGHAGGEVAAEIAAKIITAVLVRQRSTDPAEIYAALREALERADAAIEMRSSKERQLYGMGTTAVAAVFGSQGFVHCHIGDSRLYQFSGEELIYRTKDHSVVRYLLEEGIISEEEAKSHPYRAHLTSSLGGGREANRLTIEPQWNDPESPLRAWSPGDRVLLCSDGLNTELSEQEIRRVLTQAEGSRAAAERLLEATLATVARDNVTVIVAQRH